MQYNFFAPDSDWRPPKIEDLPEMGSVIAIDTENKDPYLGKIAPAFVNPKLNGRLVGVSVSNGETHTYLPIRQEGGDNVDKNTAYNWLQRQIDQADRVVFANAQYDLGWLEWDGIEVPTDKIHDVMIMAPLIDENRFSFSLNNLSKDYLGRQKDESGLEEAAKAFKIDAKKDLWKLPGRYVGPYAEEDAALTFELHQIFKNVLKKEELERVYETERRLIPVLLDMRKKGVRIDVDRAYHLKRDFQNRETEALEEIKRVSGLKANPFSNVQVGKALDACGVEYNLTGNGVPNITADFLETVDHPIGRAIRDARRFQKAYSTFIQNYILDRQIDGRIHAQFNQMPSDEGGTVSGRFSSSDPNLQNIPGDKDPEIGNAIRSCFLPEEGEYWLSADYANQEPRITVHWAAEAGIEKADSMVQRYKDEPTVSYHKIVEEWIKDFVPQHLNSYKTAKTINLGLAYGMGGAKLCKQLGLPTVWRLPPGSKVIDDYGNRNREWLECKQDEPGAKECPGEEGLRLLNKYHEEVPFIRKLSKLAEKRAKKRGYIRTLLKRRCRLEKGFEHKALNRLIQGSAADQAKEAMLEAAAKDHRMLITLHDEVCFSVKSYDEAREIKQIMETALQMRVPFICETDIGPSWGEADEIEL